MRRALGHRHVDAGRRELQLRELLPGYVTWGSRHLPVNVPAITWAGFHVDDAEAIFYDFDAMG